MITGIEHTAIASADPRRLAAWYVETLGFVINYQSKNSPTTFVKAPNGAMLEIIESSAPLQPAGMRDAGFRHLALSVSDFSSAYESLKSANVEFLTGPELRGGNQTVFFRDPDGNILHLLQRTNPLP
jgi:glyoxylase I family protein